MLDTYYIDRRIIANTIYDILLWWLEIKYKM